MKLLILPVVISVILTQNALATGTVFLEDDFNDGSLNTSIWQTTGKTVQEQDGVADLRMDETDNGGMLSTEFAAKNKIRMEVKHMMHPGGEHFFPGFFFIATDSEGDFAVQWENSNYGDDYCNNSNWLNKIRFSLKNLIGTTSSCTNAVFSDLTSSNYYDKWVTSVIEYDVTTGKITLDANNDSVVDATVTMNSGKRFPIKKITVSPFGWWTGHWHKIDYIKLIDLETTSVATPTPSTSSCATAPTFDFNSGRLVIPNLAVSITPPFGGTPQIFNYGVEMQQRSGSFVFDLDLDKVIQH